MIAKDTLRATLPADVRLPAGLPNGSAIQCIAFVSEKNSGQAVVLELPMPILRYAVSVKPDSNEQNTLQALTIPTNNHQDADLQLAARDWVAAGALENKSPLEMMTLQGSQVFWTVGRVAILAQGDRLEAVRLALIEAFWFESELCDIERTLGDAWPQMEADLPLAFAFNERALRKQPQLKKRFQQVLLIRARLARLGPHVHAPHLHPPTLASQVAERFRERSRMLHRHGFLEDQVDVFEKVYDSCGQRASDFVQSRTGHMLEWIIIILLLTQSLLWGFGLLTSMGK